MKQILEWTEGGRHRMQGEQLPVIGRPRLSETTPVVGNMAALPVGNGEGQCLSTRGNPLVVEACRATSAGVHFFFKKLCEDALGNLCTCGGRAAVISTWHLPGYEHPSMQPWAGYHPCGMGLNMGGMWQLGPFYTRAKSYDLEIVEDHKKVSKGRPNTPPKSCSVAELGQLPKQL